MSFLESLFLNYLPLVAILGGLIWYFRRPKKQSPSPVPVVASSPSTGRKLPVQADRLRIFANDMSGGHTDLTTLVKLMKKEGHLPAGVPEDAAEQYDLLFKRMTGRTGTIRAKIAVLPEELRYSRSGPEVSTAFARQAFEVNSLKLLEIEPPLGWDTYVFAAIPKDLGKRWNMRALRATKNTDRNKDISVKDAYFAGANFIEAQRPVALDYYEGKTGERSLTITPYWKES